MRLVSIRAPKGSGKHIAELAFAAGIDSVSISSAEIHSPKKENFTQDVIDIQTSTPVAKKFVESLLTDPEYNSETYSIAVRHPKAIFADKLPEELTHPVYMPASDVYEEAWQYSHVTSSFVLRVFFAALLLSYGLLKMKMLMLIGGLLFLPYHHHIGTMALGGSIREWRVVRQGLAAFAVATGVIFVAGMCIAFLNPPPVEFHEFSSPLVSLGIATIVGSATAFATADDAGQRALIGLATTAHISIYPAWFGLKLIFGFSEGDSPVEHLLVFLMNDVVLLASAWITFVVIGLKGDGIRRIIGQQLSGEKS